MHFGCTPRLGKELLLLVLLVQPACRMLNQMPSSRFHSDAGTVDAIEAEVGTDQADTPSVLWETNPPDEDATASDADLPDGDDDGGAVDVPEEVYEPDAEALPDASAVNPEDPALPDAAVEIDSGPGEQTDAEPDAAIQPSLDALGSTDSFESLAVDAAPDCDELSSRTNPSGTGTATATRSGTGSATSSRTTTATGSGTSSGSASATGTGSGTGSQTSTGTRSATATSTGATTGTGTGSGTGTGTGVSIAVSGVAISKSTDTIALGRTDQLTAIVSPANASNKAVTWSSSNSNVASVSNQGLVTAKGKGTASITVTTVDGRKTSSCTVTVSVPVASVSLDTPTATIGTGGAITLTANILPVDASNKAMTWTSSNDGIVSLEPNGTSVVVTGIGAGSTTVVATTTDGSKTASCIITVALSAQWVRTPPVAASSSTFSAVASDSAGNIYAGGFISGTGLFTFGNSVQVTGASPGSNLVLVKYTASGTAQWARTIAPAPGASSFSGVAVDSAGNIFAVGTLSGTGPFDFGNSVVITGSYAFGNNLVIVKYNGTGTAQWARTVTGSYGVTSFTSVAVDASGNAYATGMISDSASYNLGNSVLATGIASSGKNALLVKYQGDGRTLWAQTPKSGSGESFFASMALGSGGDIFAAGYISGTAAYGFGNSVTAKGPASLNALLVKYNASGVAQWAKAPDTGSSDSVYNAVAVSSQGRIYVAGGIYGISPCDFGGGVKVAGAAATGNTMLLLKYGADGIPLWGQSLLSATGLSRLSSLALDAEEHLYGVGLLAGPGSYDFGNEITAEATSKGNEILLVKYDATGVCERAQTAATGSSISGFVAATIIPTGGICASGYINGTNPVDFGNSLTASGAYSGGYNAVLVKYR